MSSSNPNALAKNVTFTDDSFSVHLLDGRILIVPLAYFPRLLHAAPEQLRNYELSGGGTGIHWDDIDEDISVEGLLQGKRDQTSKGTPTSHRSKTA